MCKFEFVLQELINQLFHKVKRSLTIHGFTRVTYKFIPNFGLISN